MHKDRYEILEPLGCGATSRVDKARDTLLGRTVALKTLVHSFGAAPEQKQFLREAQIVGQLSHPSIVNLYDVGIEESGIAYLVMEYVAGKTLQHAIAQSPIPFPRACAWAADLATALGRAHHAGIIHGDVKPANIMVTEEGTVKLGDFGIARFATQVSGSGRLMGTPAYLSPEQILGEPQDMRSDLFSLGVVLYQMLTRTRPFDGSSVGAVCAQILSSSVLPPSHYNPAVPPALDRVVMRCLSKTPADRYPSGEALAASLYPFARQAPPPQPKKVSWMKRPIRPLEAWGFVGAAVIAACCVPFVYAVSGTLRIPPPAFHVAAPSVPADLLAYSSISLETVANGANSHKQLSLVAPKNRSTHAASAGPKIQPSLVAAKPAVPDETVPKSLPLSKAPAFSAPSMDSAPLHIEIDDTIVDGTLAIYSDSKLVLTTELHADLSSEPLRLERTFPIGAHQVRVALYRSDRSLQTEKEGLADIRADVQNNLRIHVTKHSKLLVHREVFLEVAWPAAITPALPGSSSIAAAK